MLITFNVGNYRSFKDIVSFNMLAAKITSKNKELDDHNLFSLDQSLELLKSAVIYGANASGKSNLLQAIDFMRKFVITSSKESQSTDPIPVENFKLSTETENKPSYFEIIFFLNNKRYRYGFEADRQKVHSEWLYHVPSQRETNLFLREDNNFKLSSVFREGKGLETRTRNNALFLSVVAQFNGEISQNILDWFKRLNIISGLSDVGYRGFTLESMGDEVLKQRIVSFVKELDFGIADIQVEAVTFDPDIHFPKDLPPELRNFILKQSDGATAFDVATLHKKYNRENVSTSLEIFDFDNQESEGTKKLFYLSGPIIDTLRSGKILLIDELDARFHPLITSAIINLFNSSITNPNNAQLVFATHDVKLLGQGFFRRDQIWFTEKDRFGATDLYSLVEYRVRNDAPFEKDYISGKYGAIPFIGNIQELVKISDV